MKPYDYVLTTSFEHLCVEILHEPMYTLKSNPNEWWWLTHEIGDKDNMSYYPEGRMRVIPVISYALAFVFNKCKIKGDINEWEKILNECFNQLDPMGYLISHLEK